MRRLTDREFCCDAHRSMARTPSARALRDEPDLNEKFEEAWLDHTPVKSARAKATSAVGQSTITALGLSVLGVIIVAMMDQSGSHAPASRASSSGSNAIWQSMQGALERIPKPKPQVRLQDDFLLLTISEHGCYRAALALSMPTEHYIF